MYKQNDYVISRNYEQQSFNCSSCILYKSNDLTVTNEDVNEEVQNETNPIIV